MDAGQDLCWKCKEYYRGYFPLNPDVHCHHQPRYKRRCWCDKIENKKDESVIDAVPVRVLFCPECGKSLRLKKY